VVEKGSLVVKKSRWDIESSNLGIVIEESNLAEDAWLVLWCEKGSYFLKVHLGSALLSIDGNNDKKLLSRLCTSM
jgi:hypothetical protein